MRVLVDLRHPTAYVVVWPEDHRAFKLKGLAKSYRASLIKGGCNENEVYILEPSGKKPKIGKY